MGKDTGKQTIDSVTKSFWSLKTLSPRYCVQQLRHKPSYTILNEHNLTTRRCIVYNVPDALKQPAMSAIATLLPGTLTPSASTQTAANCIQSLLSSLESRRLDRYCQ